MSLAEKMATLAARSQAVPKALETRADALLSRLDSLEAKGVPVFDGLDGVLSDAEKGVAEAESAMRQLSNGPLPGSSASPTSSVPISVPGATVLPASNPTAFKPLAPAPTGAADGPHFDRTALGMVRR